MFFSLFCAAGFFHILDQTALCDSDLPAVLREVSAYEFFPVNQYFPAVIAACAQAFWISAKMVSVRFCSIHNHRLWK